MSVGSFTEAKSTIRTMFDGPFKIAYPSTDVDIVYDNVTYKPTTKNAGGKTFNKPYVELKITTSDSMMVSHGRPGYRRFRVLGIIIARVYTNGGDGEGLNTEICDKVASIFRGQLNNGLMTDEPKLDTVGESAGFYRQDVITPFRFTIIA